MKTVAIVQARMGSSRLPGKVLRDLNGRSMLERVIRRVSRAQTVDLLVVATTTETADDVLVTACEQWGVTCWRGSEADVLDRFYGAGMAYAADTVVRITSDCPLIDPAVIDGVVTAFYEADVDYANTGLASYYPRGLDTEVMRMAALTRAWQEATEMYERSHVTPYLYQNPSLFTILPVTSPAPDLRAWRWTVDTAADLALVQAIYAHFEGRDDMSWLAVRDWLQTRPDLVALNAQVVQKDLHEG